MTDTEHQIIEWMASRHTGTSSKAMAFCALGVTNKSPFGNSTPADPSDFNRCLGLLDAAPAVRDSFPQIACMSPKWHRLIDRWDEVESLLRSEMMSGRGDGTAPLTYALLNEINDRVGAGCREAWVEQ